MAISKINIIAGIIDRIVAENASVEIYSTGDPTYYIMRIDDQQFTIIADGLAADVAITPMTG